MSWPGAGAALLNYAELRAGQERWAEAEGLGKRGLAALGEGEQETVRGAGAKGARSPPRRRTRARARLAERVRLEVDEKQVHGSAEPNGFAVVGIAFALTASSHEKGNFLANLF